MNDRSTLLRSTASLAFLLIPAVSTWGLDINGFQPAKGEGTLALSTTTESYDKFWVGETKVSDPGVGEVETTSLTLWGQYGFTDRLALVVNLPYVDVDSDGFGGFGDSGLQDLSALLKFRLVDVESGSGLRHTLIGGAGFRTAIDDYEANLPVDLGDNTDDALVRLVYQLRAGNFYFSQQAGFDLRGGDAPDGFPLVTELGYTFGAVTLSAYYSNYIADGGTDIGDPGFTFPSNQDETTRVGAKVYGRIGEHFGLAASGFTTLDGRNSGDIEGFSLSVVYRF